VTILNVDVSKDLQHARVRFSTLADTAKEIDAAKAGFESCKSYIRKLISQRLPLRYTPEFQFFYDKGIKHASDVDKVLEEIKQLKKAE
jgi:ribosome-binding factor A